MGGAIILKIHVRKIYSSSVFAAQRKITHQFDTYLQSNEDIVLDMLNAELQHYPNYIQDAYVPYLYGENVSYHVTDDQQGNLRINILLKVPYQNLILCNIFQEGAKYEKYIQYIQKYVESGYADSTFVGQAVFSTWVYIKKNDTVDTVEDQILEELKTGVRYDLECGYYYDSSGKIQSVEFDDFLEYIRSNLKKSKKSKYASMVHQLKLEAEDGINSIYEQTESGAYIDSIVQSVEDSVGVWSEPSIQGGFGSIAFIDTSTDDVIVEKDYEEYCDDIIDMAIRSKSKKDFISQLEQYYDM